MQTPNTNSQAAQYHKQLYTVLQQLISIYIKLSATNVYY
jgi:hypothetical protein